MLRPLLPSSSSNFWRIQGSSSGTRTVPGAVLHVLGVADELRQRMERQVAGRRRADVEVLVEPAIRRDEHAQPSCQGMTTFSSPSGHMIE